MSWPQCPTAMGMRARRALGLAMPLRTARFVVLGLTDGPGFVANPCLARQVSWVKHRHLLAAAYSVISAPARGQLGRYGGRGPFDRSRRSGRWANLGYQEARFNVATMRAAGLESPTVWLDIEPLSHPEWTGDKVANASVVRGATRGYRDAGLTVGVYSLPKMWHALVGGLRLGLPEWRPVGVIEGNGWRAALSRCGRDWAFQGGAAALVQWTADDRDRDVTCGGGSDVMQRWFHQY